MKELAAMNEEQSVDDTGEEQEESKAMRFCIMQM